MTMNAGVWIDHHKAVVVLLTVKGEDVVLQFLAEGEASTQAPGVVRAKNTYSPNDFVAEDKLERKGAAHLNHYYDQVIDALRDAHEIVILGPGEAKTELRTRIEHKKLRGQIIEMKTTDKLTDRQISDYIRKHFQSTEAV
jgi:hypothetical protein